MSLLYIKILGFSAIKSYVSFVKCIIEMKRKPKVSL